MSKSKKLTHEDDALLAELGIEIESVKTARYSVTEERVIAGFKEIQKFVERNGRLPDHGEEKGVFERLYAVRLDQLRKKKEFRTLLEAFDHKNILSNDFGPETEGFDEIDDDKLLAQLGVNKTLENTITNIKHVKSRSEKRISDEIANRARCKDFERFKPLFTAVKNDIETGYRNTIHFRKDAGFTKTSLKQGQFIIISGQIVYIAEIGETFKAPNGDDDARLRVIYANGTESNILLRSLIRAMYKDETSRFITEPNRGALFSGENSEGDNDSGTIYVLRSSSDHPIVKENREIVHKIGVTGGDVKKRFGNVKNDPTFLMADVEIIATYKLANINRTKLEKVIHKFFNAANLDIQIRDRFGKPVRSQEWFLVPVFIIDKMVDKIKEGTVSDYYYDPASVELKKH